MLSRFEVKGFKSLVDVSVDLGAVNVFIGANGSGKSNLLEAIGFLGAVGANGPDPEAFRYRGLRDGSPKSYLSAQRGREASQLVFNAVSVDTTYYAEIAPQSSEPWSWEINKEIVKHYGKVIAERKGEIGQYLVNESHTMNLTLRPDRSAKSFAFGLTKIPSAPISDLEWLESASKNELSKLNPTVTIDLLDNFAIFCPTTPQLRGFLDDIHRIPLGLGGSNIGRAIKEMLTPDLTKLGPFDIDDVLNLIEWADEIGTTAQDNRLDSEVPIRLSIGDRFMGDDHKTVSATEASEGALYVLFLLTLVGHDRSPRMFGVDNFDQALHPRLARELTSLICDQILGDGTRQMFATTHNPLVLDGLDLLDDRIRLFTVDRDKNGASKVERVEVTEKLLELADKGMGLSRLWTMGRLGGVPENF